MVWKQVYDFPLYEVSDIGEVRNSNTGKVLRLHKDKDGYPSVGLWANGKQSGRKVHRLVAEAFIGPRPSLSHQVAHNDGRRDNNEAANLRWATCLENQRDRALHGTAPSGRRNGRSILTHEAVQVIRSADLVRGYRAELAKRFGVKPMTISCIRWDKGKWAHG